MSKLPATHASNLLQPSASFKKEVTRSILAILAFIIVYLILIALSICLAGACMYGGLALIINFPRWITILIGAGLVGLGVMVFAFLIKFLFASSKTDGGDRIEITAADQPALVEFIHNIARETGTPKPKKIFISRDVNAYVFYNSSFWSMFLPVRKNLNIGLGLVNILNVSELKAVIAHEFGHFSQRSMKLGSFVYHVNHIIYDMLFNNTGYANTLSGFARVHAVFGFFAEITISIVRGIQWVLQQMYKLVNLSYLGLSREMEFHADLVAATVSGSNNIINSLKRAELAEFCFQNTLQFYDRIWKENKKALNIYDDHKMVMQHFAQSNKFQLVDGLPVMAEWAESSMTQRINVRNQWASHPSIKDRKAYLDQYQLEGVVDTTTAWSLIRNPDAIKQQVTQKIYQEIDPNNEKATIDPASFETLYKKEVQDFTLPEIFSGYYDDRRVEIFDVEECLKAAKASISFESLFTEPIRQLPKKIQQISADIELLEGIENKKIDVKTFDFDGTKHASKDAATIKLILQQELDKEQQALKTADEQLFLCFYNKALESSATEAGFFAERYKSYFKHRKDADQYLQLLENILQMLQPIFSGNALSNENIMGIIVRLKESPEKELKQNLKNWMSLGAFENDAELKEKTAKFTEADYQYFSGSHYFDNELQDLNTLIYESWKNIHVFLFNEFRKILQLQANLMQAVPSVERK